MPLIVRHLCRNKKEELTNFVKYIKKNSVHRIFTLDSCFQNNYNRFEQKSIPPHQHFGEVLSKWIVAVKRIAFLSPHRWRSLYSVSSAVRTVVFYRRKCSVNRSFADGML